MCVPVFSPLFSGRAETRLASFLSSMTPGGKEEGTEQAVDHRQSGYVQVQ